MDSTAVGRQEGCSPGLSGPAGPVARSARGRLAVVDSGLGGLTVVAALRRLLPSVALTYVADSAAFPYGGLSPQAVQKRILAVVGAVLMRERVDAVVIACNTATTAGLGLLQAAFPMMRFIGTVPAVERAALATRSGVIGLLATPATIDRPMIDHLTRRHAAGCTIIRLGAERLAGLAEGKLRGAPPGVDAVRAEIEPLFAHGTLDVVILGCTHYPLLRRELEAAAPRPVQWMDAADAVAAQAVHLLQELPRDGGRGLDDGDRTLVTAAMPGAELAFVEAGLPPPEILDLAGTRRRRHRAGDGLRSAYHPE